MAFVVCYFVGTAKRRRLLLTFGCSAAEISDKR